MQKEERLAAKLEKLTGLSIIILPSRVFYYSTSNPKCVLEKWDWGRLESTLKWTTICS
jgi:hypothetical protein